MYLFNPAGPPGTWGQGLKPSFGALPAMTKAPTRAAPPPKASPVITKPAPSIVKLQPLQPPPPAGQPARYGVKQSLWTKLNQSFARALSPSVGAVSKLKLLTPAQKAQFRTRPLDFYMDTFDPIEDTVNHAVADVIKKTGRAKRTLGGRRFDLRRVQPGDAMFDASTRNLLQRLRTIQSFQVLLLTDPLNFGAALGNNGLGLVGNTVAKAAGAAKNAVDAVGKAAESGVKSAKKAAKAVSDFFGLGGTDAEGNTAMGVAVAAGPAAALAFDGAIKGILSLIVKNAPGPVKGAAKGMKAAILKGKADASDLLTVVTGGAPAGSISLPALPAFEEDTVTEPVDEEASGSGLIIAGGVAAALAAVWFVRRKKRAKAA